MNFKLRALALATAAVLGGNAHAQLAFPNTGDASVMFIAIDSNNNIGLTIDLGLSMSSFTESTALTSGLTSALTWNFATNTTTAPVTGTNAWSDAYATFKATQSGGDYRWAVIGADNISGTAAPAQRNTLSTGNATVAQMTALTTAAPVSNALGVLDSFYAASNNFGNFRTAGVNNGAAAVDGTSGVAYLNNPGAIADNFTGFNTWRYLMADGESSTFQRVQQFANPLVFQLGSPIQQDGLSAAPILFTFDIASDTLVLAPIPEPSTYAMLLAGLAAVGFMARRRKV